MIVGNDVDITDLDKIARDESVRKSQQTTAKA